jgi:hypothetical protein
LENPAPRKTLNIHCYIISKMKNKRYKNDTEAKLIQTGVDGYDQKAIDTSRIITKHTYKYTNPTN